MRGQSSVPYSPLQLWQMPAGEGGRVLVHAVLGPVTAPHCPRPSSGKSSGAMGGS